jgi:hypothetical protein
MAMAAACSDIVSTTDWHCDAPDYGAHAHKYRIPEFQIPESEYSLISLTSWTDPSQSTLSTEIAAMFAPKVCGYRIPIFASPELSSSMNALESLATLKQDWDQAGGEPINRLSIQVAKVFLAQVPPHIRIAPQVVPMSLGRLQLEWHRGTRSLEIEFESPSLIHYLKWDSARSFEEENFIPVSNDWRAVNSLLSWFAQGSADAERG